MVQLSHPYMTTGKTIVLTTWATVGKLMSLLFNMLLRLVITFLPKSKRLLISWLQSPSAVMTIIQSDLCLQKRKFGHTKSRQGCALTEERPCEDTARRRTSVSQGQKPQQKSNTLIPWFWMSGFQNCEKINFCCLSHPVCGILLWQSYKTSTHVVELISQFTCRSLQYW